MSIVLFVDDEDHLRRVTGQTFQLANIPIQLFEGASELLSQLHRGFDGIVISDIRMPDMDGIELLQEVLKIDPELPVILVTGQGDIDLAVRCMQQGAYDFIEKPYEPNRLVKTAQRALETRRLTQENRELRSRLSVEGDVGIQLSGQSQAIKNVRQQLNTLARLETDVLLVGETGTGKDIAARILHNASSRADWPFVYINCAALPDDLVEIELFGHEAGAFPSATHSRYGKFEHARGGTVFLDGIENLPLNVQAKILHAVQDRKITRLGSNDPVELDIRLIAATKLDLRKEIDSGRFRSDLYYRLASTQVYLPTLDQRREDIALLFAELVERASARHKCQAPDIASNVPVLLMARNWPGNVRELKNVAERFVLGLDLELSAVYHSGGKDMSLSSQLANHERALIAASLKSHGGRLNKTYEALGISRKALYEKMQKYRLNREDFGEE